MKAKLTVLALIFAACGGTPQPGDPGYSYNLVGEYTSEITADDGSAFTATFQLETLPGGEVVGTMSITDPMTITGEMSGLLVGAEAALEMTYLIADQGCGGAFAGSVVIDEGGEGGAGTMEVTEDGCGGGPTALSFDLVRN